MRWELQELTRLLLGLPPVIISADWQIGGSSLYREVRGQGKEIVVFDLARELPVRWHRLSADGRPELADVAYTRSIDGNSDTELRFAHETGTTAGPAVKKAKKHQR